jgi:hypothetical protein
MSSPDEQKRQQILLAILILAIGILGPFLYREKKLEPQLQKKKSEIGRYQQIQEDATPVPSDDEMAKLRAEVKRLEALQVPVATREKFADAPLASPEQAFTRLLAEVERLNIRTRGLKSGNGRKLDLSCTYPDLVRLLLGFSESCGGRLAVTEIEIKLGRGSMLDVKLTLQTREIPVDKEQT